MRMTRKKTLYFVAAALTLSAASMACSAILGLEPPPEGASGEGGTDVDAAGGCMTRYVSTRAPDDNGGGCTPDKPLKTIAAAISAYETAGVTGYTIKVCAGTYPETDLRIESRGALLGGYSCDTWQRTGTYATDLVNDTEITVKTIDSNHEVSLLLSPPIVDAGVTTTDAEAPEGGAANLLVDGFSIVGPSGTAESYAVRVNQGATGTISNCRLLAGDATNLSAGIFVQSATPTIANNTILSGRAAVTVGVDVQTTSSSPYIHSNTITSKDVTDGVTGSTNGSYGVLVNNSGSGNGVDANRIDDNTVVSGNGPLSAGIRLAGIAKGGLIRRNRVQTLTSGKASSIGPMRGISVDTSNGVQILQNRVYSGGSNAGVGPLFGIFVYEGANVVVANNMVYGGYDKPIAMGSNLNATGIALIGTKNPIAVYNTIFSGFAPGFGGRAYDISIGTSAIDGTTTTNAIIQNNILAGSGVNDFGMLVDNCGNGIDMFENNAFFAQQTGLVFLSCADAGAVRNVQDIAGLGKMGAKALDGNVTLRSMETCGKTGSAGACVVQSQCPFYGLTTTLPDGGPNDGGANLDGSPLCVESVFGAWSNDDGNSTLFNPGWTLAPVGDGGGAPCAVSAGGLDLTSAGFTTDLYGKQRDAAPSMGAAQANPVCP